MTGDAPAVPGLRLCSRVALDHRMRWQAHRKRCGTAKNGGAASGAAVPDQTSCTVVVNHGYVPLLTPEMVSDELVLLLL